MGEDTPRSLVERILGAAWHHQTRAMRTLAAAAAAVLVMSVAAEPLRRTSVPAILVALAVGGGVVLVLRGLFTFKIPKGIAAGFASLLFGSALVVGGTALSEVYLTADGDGPFTRWLSDALGPGPCTISVVDFVEIGTLQDLAQAKPSPEQLQRIETRQGSQRCSAMKELPALRLSGDIDLRGERSHAVWASVIEIASGARLILGDSRLVLVAIDLRGTGEIIAWPRAEAAVSGREPGAPGFDGANGGEVVLDLLGTAGRVAIDLSGQRGGSGAKGKNGTPGTTGARGRNGVSGILDCRRGGSDGGRGGDGSPGGRGGDGGGGGDGGILKLVRGHNSKEVLEALSFLEVEAEGGPAGEGGNGGGGGPGGRGGSGSTWCKGGHNGPPGNQGPPGPEGQPGTKGEIPKKVLAST